jgi:hypothetical protein
MLRAFLVALSLLAALPAAAQDTGGVHTRGALSELSQIQANSGCPLSTTSVTVGVNKTLGMQSSAQQHLATMGSGGLSGCRPLVSTQVVAGANLALGDGSNAGQSITAQGPRGVLGTTTYTRGYNLGYGAGSTANQRLINQTSR